MAGERLKRLRAEMESRGIFAYVVPTADFHESEYVGAHFKAREYLTGFTGSAGTAVVTMDEAGLWTDGRYFVQAKEELLGSAFKLYRDGDDGVPSVEEYLEGALPEGGVIGFDGRVVNDWQAGKFREIAEKKSGSIASGEDLVGLIWEGRPAISASPATILEERYAGEGAREKIAWLRGVMREKGADCHIISSLCDIAWLLNVRGGDVEYVPVVLSYLAVTMDECVWFVQDAAVTGEVASYLASCGVRTRPYGEALDYARSIAPGSKVLIDRSLVSERIAGSLAEGVEVIDEPNPTELKKAVKNETELSNIIEAHLRDGAAVTRFLYWIKTRIGRERITELSAASRLEELRREQEHYLGPSFETICAFGPHAAMMHYAATKESDAVLEPEGFLLVDSGGHYLEGTTDITRTIALGPVTDEMTRHFTAVCRANLNLAAARFLEGCTGQNLDILAREPLWEMGIDYKCGTGHGVGYALSVHEGPNSIRWKKARDRQEPCALKEGMITTDEPGVYLEGRYGIRTENELVCRKAGKNEYGQFLRFEAITYAPIDLDAIDPGEMTHRERRLLNEYHAMVREKISPRLEKREEREFLAQCTREI